MKITILILTLGLSLAVASLSAQVVTSDLYRIQTDPATGQVEAFFESSVEIDGQTFAQPKRRVAWAIGSAEPVTITLADGTEATTTRAAILAAVVAIANEEKTKADSSPEPVEGPPNPEPVEGPPDPDPTPEPEPQP